VVTVLLVAFQWLRAVVTVGLDDLQVMFFSRRTVPFRLGTSGDLVRLSQVLLFKC